MNKEQQKLEFYKPKFSLGRKSHIVLFLIGAICLFFIGDSVSVINLLGIFFINIAIFNIAEKKGHKNGYLYGFEMAEYFDKSKKEEELFFKKDNENN